MWRYRCYHPLTHELLFVEAFHQRAIRGEREASGAPLEPDTPESLHIVRVTDRSGISLSEAAQASIEEALIAEGFYARDSGLLL